MTLRVGGSASRGGGPFETCPEASDFLEHTWCMRRSPGSQSQSESPGVAPAAQSLAWRSVSENKDHMLCMSQPARRSHTFCVAVGTCVHRGLASNPTLCHVFFCPPGPGALKAAGAWRGGRIRRATAQQRAADTRHGGRKTSLKNPALWLSGQGLYSPPTLDAPDVLRFDVTTLVALDRGFRDTA